MVCSVGSESIRPADRATGAIGFQPPNRHGSGRPPLKAGTERARRSEPDAALRTVRSLSTGCGGSLGCRTDGSRSGCALGHPSGLLSIRPPRHTLRQDSRWTVAPAFGAQALQVFNSLY